jgi:hypothetical protein
MAEINFPSSAVDGTTFFHEDKVCVYHEASNTWECRAVSTETPTPPSNIYTTDVLVPDGLRENIRTARVGVPPEVDNVRVIQTQYDANQALLKETILSAKNLARNSDLLDFTQNTAVQGYWVHTIDEGGAPGEAEFYAYDENGFNTTEFKDIRLIKFNDNGLAANPGTENVLETSRVGDYLIMQELNQNHFGMYVVTGITTYNTEGVIYREFGVKLYRGARAFGDCEYSAHCSVRVIRPSYVVVQDDQPFASDRGVLWYRESDDILSISNYGDGFTGIGPQWTEINGSTGGGGGGVSVGENPPADPTEGALWFDTARLELYVYYVEGQDGSWVPTSPLGARVSAGEILQQQILGRVDAIEGDYLPTTGGVITGNLAVAGSLSNQGGIMMTAPKDKGFYVYDTQAGAVFSAYGDKFGSGVQYFGGITQPNHITTKDYTDSNYVGLSGDNVVENGWKIKSGDQTFFHVEGGQSRIYYLQDPNDDRHPVPRGYADNRYVNLDQSNDVTTSFRIKAGGNTLISAGGNELGLYHVKDPTTGNPEWAATKGYVDGEIAKIGSGGGGGSFQTKYDGNRFCLGQSVLLNTSVGSGQVAFYGSAQFGETVPANVRYIGLNIDEFNWDSFIGSGIIRVRNGANDAGFYQVYHKTENAGRNMLLHVSPVWTSNTQVLEGDTGTPCYFQGVFFE